MNFDKMFGGLLIQSYNILILFLLVFGFQISGINTRIIAGSLVLIICCLKGKFSETINILLKKPFRWLLLGTGLYSLITLIITYLHFHSDIAYFQGVFRIFILLVICAFFWISLSENKKSKIEKYLIYIYLVQSIIIIIAFLSPSFFKIVQMFQYENVQDVANRYLTRSVYRGLALSGDQFFGLSASFGLMMIFVINNYVNSANLKWLIILFLLTFSNMFVGRTGFVGLGFSFLFLFLYPNKPPWIITRMLLYIFWVLFSFVLLFPSVLQVLQDVVFPYAFQLYYNYVQYGSFSSSSTDRLFEMYEESNFGFITILIGDGLFLQPNGSYYKSTDSGYMRQIFYGGVFFLLYTIAFYAKLLFKISYSFFVVKIFQMDKASRLLSMVIFIYSLVLHFKGMTLWYCPEIMIIVFFYCFRLIHKYSGEKDSVVHSQTVE